MSGNSSPRTRSAKRGPSNFGPTDPAEASLSLLVWVSAPSQSSSSTGEKLVQLSKAPLLIRDVPQVRRKLTKRDSKNLNHGTSSGFIEGSEGRTGSPAGTSTQHSAAAWANAGSSHVGANLGSIPTAQLEAESLITSARAVSHASANVEGVSSSRNPLSFVKSKPGWLKEKSSRSRLTMPSGVDSAMLGGSTSSLNPPMLPGGVGSLGNAGSSVASNRGSGWRRGTAIFREDGVLSIYGEDRALLHSIHAPSLRASDVRKVDDSLFARPHVLGIFASPSVFSLTSAKSPRTPNTFVSATTPSTQGRDEPVYLCFPSLTKLARWRAVLRLYAQPEVYGPLGTVNGTHRIHRQIDMSIFEARFKSATYANSSSAEHPGGGGRMLRHLASSSGHGLTHVTSSSAGQRWGQFNGQDAAKMSSDQQTSRTSGATSSRASEGGAPTTSHSAVSMQPTRSSSSDSHSAHGHFGVARHSSSSSPAPSARVIVESDEEGCDGAADKSMVTGGEEDEDDGEDEVDGVQSGPISGLAGAARAAAIFPGADTWNTAAATENLKSKKRTLRPPRRIMGSAAGIGLGSAGLSPTEVNSYRHSASNTNSSAQPPFTACYCLLFLSGLVAARTKVKHAPNGGFTWAEKFVLTDLPVLDALQIDVMTATGNPPSRAAGSSTSTNASSGQSLKYSLTGSVDLPINTMRRGEDIDGWFPVWAQRLDDAYGSDKYARLDMSYGREMIGEVHLKVRVREEIILPRVQYAEIEKALNRPGCVPFVQALAKELDDSQLIPHLVDVWTSSQTIADRIGDLADAESASQGGRLETELLFRGNTLLSRSLDQFQRLYCSDWLDASIGRMVRRICTERIWLNPDDDREATTLQAVPSATMQTAGPPLASSALTRSATSHSCASGDNSQGSINTPATPVLSTVERLKRLSIQMWDSIYGNRHACPPDLRRALFHIRTTVNARFAGHANVKPPGPGFQGVGAFVFLRLICPAITSPNLYGLTATAPDSQSHKTLMLVAKMFLALANKRPAFDKDKEPWLVQASDFLRNQAATYDDYITAVSTLPPQAAPEKLTALGDDEDFALQRAAQARTVGLSVLHRESIPTPTYLLDRPLALASLVSYVVRTLHMSRFDVDRMSSLGKTTSVEELGNAGVDEALDAFIDACCNAEDEAGYVVDTAGIDPTPIDLQVDGASVHSGTSSSISIGTSTARSNLGAPSFGSGSRTATLRETESFNDQQYNNNKLASSFGRSRRATVSAVTSRAERRNGRASPALPSHDQVSTSIGGDQSDDELRAAYQTFRETPLQSLGGGAYNNDRRHSANVAGGYNSTQDDGGPDPTTSQTDGLDTQSSTHTSSTTGGGAARMTLSEALGDEFVDRVNNDKASSSAHRGGSDQGAHADVYDLSDVGRALSSESHSSPNPRIGDHGLVSTPSSASKRRKSWWKR
ncbi:hypothetical protein IE81DRAFT_171323 [Ceraceosorus guamensis]|uniref:Ras-GAP domain-containing protein n=1 Tax=Ceraceosorus guamensis TaxID=1522189 RepID=A0A316VW71_9BASI|nr:hypothetical protein IE81DRAFT_171323 [Ceraceosorus guamensis]PWN41544.1 hypothetical protein IE81DRAFT_171323 [Ceraceosorus guamensis]